MLVWKLRGHYAYYGIAGNSSALSSFRREAARVWRKWLQRRSRKARIPWTGWSLLERMCPLPAGHIVRPHVAKP